MISQVSWFGSGRVSPFSDVRLESRLDNKAIASSTLVSSRLECGERCGKEPNCLSFNFCGDRVCTLNSIGAFHPDFAANVVHSVNCVYVGMTQDEHPECEDRGVPVDIQDDETDSKCAINLKRLDGWEKTTDGDVELWECIRQASHGGVDCADLVLIEKYRMDFTDAREVCSRHQAEMFDDVHNETKLQLIFKAFSFDESFWCALFKVSNDGWVNNDDQYVDDLWPEGYREGSQCANRVAMIRWEESFRFDVACPSYKHNVVCEKPRN